MRIGYFGGTFDPPHRGHLAVAKAARDAFRLDRVLLAPTGLQPLKLQQRTAPFADRIAMTKLLCRGARGLRASAVDGPRGDGAANYTIDTLRRLRETLPPRSSVYAIVGADAFLDLPRWRDPPGLLAAAEWVVISRPGFDLDDVSKSPMLAAQRDRMHLLRDVAVPISSTAVREQLSDSGRSVDLLTPAVAAYVLQHHLYGQ